MTQSLVHTLRYVSAAGDGEAHWIRLEQERTDEAVTVEEAAEFMDALYGIDSCERGISGGGDPAGDDPEEERFDTAAAALMGEDICAESQYWTAYVRVYRSHQSPEYVLRSATATVESVEPGIRESVREIIETPGNSHDLELPFAGDLVLPPGVRGEVRGSTLNLSRAVNGPLVVRYTTVYDRVALHVPVSADASAQGDEDQALRSALDAAGLVAFQGEGARAVAAATTLQPPVQDNTLSAVELERLCRAAGLASGRVGGDCWRTIEHYYRCQCRGTEAPGGWKENAPAPCPAGVAAGSHVGTVRRLEGYATCPGELDEELSSQEYYRRVCCHYPPRDKSLPVCRRLHSIWRGGEPIQGGPDHWRETYGPDVRLVAVTPPDGICGTLIHEWEVNKRRCCDDVIPLEPSPDNPTTIRPGGQYVIGAQDGTGKPVDLIWQLSGGLEFHDGTTYKQHGGRLEAVRARSAVCPNPRARLDDGCYPLELVFEGDGGSPPNLSEHDMAVLPVFRFILRAGGGVPPYMWIAEEGVSILAISADGGEAMFLTASRDAWCVARITVSDQCGQSDTCTVRNAATGSWVRLAMPDNCAPPGGAGGKMLDPSAVGETYLEPRDGYRLKIKGHESNRPTFPCPAGTVLSSDGAALKEAYCRGFSRPMYHFVSYASGVCTWRRNSDDYAWINYLMDSALLCERWICGNSG